MFVKCAKLTQLATIAIVPYYHEYTHQVKQSSVVCSCTRTGLQILVSHHPKRINPLALMLIEKCSIKCEHHHSGSHVFKCIIITRK